jgi:hypothetical protein
VVKIIPTEIHQVERAAAMQGEQVVLLRGMQIKLPGGAVAINSKVPTPIFHSARELS